MVERLEVAGGLRSGPRVHLATLAQQQQVVKHLQRAATQSVRCTLDLL